MSPWSRVKAPLAALTVAVFLGAAVVAPFALPSAPADADAMAYQERIQQKFVPNESPEADLVFAVTPITELPEPEKAPKEQEEAAVAAPPKYTGGGSMAEWMTAAGIPEADWQYVYYIAERESGLNPNATNAGSGACGLIQALPCSKVPGNGYDPIDNLRWANGYAVGRYGSWAGAYAFWTSNHWW